jgi:signal transduction histidine kinase
MSASTIAAPISFTPAWLGRVYSYIGAHNVALRADNEKARAQLRVAMLLVAVIWIFLIRQTVGVPVTAAESVWMIASLAYAFASLAFWAFLKYRPEGGVHIQYAFLAFDPLIIGWALYAAPQLLAWFLVLMLVTIARVGFRYGLNAMKVELGFAWVGAALPLLFGSFWHTQLQMSASLLLMLGWAWWLCAPLIRSVEKDRLHEIERQIDRARFESMQDSLKAKSQFLSRVSHELRSPLQGVVSALDVIERRFVKDEMQAELVARIRRGATALGTQLRDLLTLARGDVGKMEINPMPFEAADLARSVAREVRVEAAAKGLELVVHAPDESIFVVADSGRIDQILTNLLTNATRHTKSGTVRLTLHPYDVAQQCLQFDVSDTGPGIEADRIPKLFEPYARFGDMTRSGDAEGAGLGLAVVRSVLRFLDGRICVTSAPGAGTTFSVTIPAEPLDGDRPRGLGQQLKRVLVVDDRPEVLEGISSVLTQLGFECDTAVSVAPAANLLGAHPYDMVFLDLDMPVKSGFDLAAETRRGDGPNRGSRIVSISAADVPDSRRGFPFDGHLTKPITMQAIQNTIASLASEHHADTRLAA